MATSPRVPLPPRRPPRRNRRGLAGSCRDPRQIRRGPRRETRRRLERRRRHLRRLCEIGRGGTEKQESRRGARRRSGAEAAGSVDGDGPTTPTEKGQQRSYGGGWLGGVTGERRVQGDGQAGCGGCCC